MGYLKYVKKLFQKPTAEAQEEQRARLLTMRREPVTIRLERPTNLSRARSLGYKPVPGVFVVRQRVTRGGRQRPDIKGGRRSAHSSQRKNVDKNYQQVAEERANRKYKNCEVLGSYQVEKDGTNYWFEVIMVDRYHASVLTRKQLAQVAVTRGRSYRAQTSAGRKARGLRNKGQGAEKLRPSKAANKGRH